MKIETSMSIYEIMELIGTEASETDAEAVKAALINSGAADTNEISEDDWNYIIEAADKRKRRYEYHTKKRRHQTENKRGAA